MTLPRKYSRPIVVDAIPYRWMLKEVDYGAWFELLLVAESQVCTNGPKLVAHIKWDDRHEDDSVTPGVVASLIREMRSVGWDPERGNGCPECNDQFLRLVRANSRKTSVPEHVPANHVAPSSDSSTGSSLDKPSPH